jgi:hypothetical protein
VFLRCGQDAIQTADAQVTSFFDAERSNGLLSMLNSTFCRQPSGSKPGEWRKKCVYTASRLSLQEDSSPLDKAGSDSLVAEEGLLLDVDSASLDAPLDLATTSNGSAGVTVALECVRSARECGLVVPRADLLCILKAATACKDGPVRPQPLSSRACLSQLRVLPVHPVVVLLRYNLSLSLGRTHFHNLSLTRPGCVQEHTTCLKHLIEAPGQQCNWCAHLCAIASA